MVSRAGDGALESSLASPVLVHVPIRLQRLCQATGQRCVFSDGLSGQRV